MQQVKKIVVIGGESTGKSTLCNDLAQHYHTVWVPEYAREYLMQLNRNYHYDDLLAIALGQIETENKYMELAEGLLFCDTDLHVIKVWSDHKYQKVHAKILNLISTLKYDAYILTAPDFPWQSDALREHPEPEMRQYFFEIYKNILTETQIPFITVYGNTRQRLNTAISFIDVHVLQ